MQYKLKIAFILILCFLLLTGCTKKNANNDLLNKGNLNTVTPTPAPTDSLTDKDPFGLKESDALYPSQVIEHGIKKYGYLRLNGDSIIDPIYHHAGLYQDGVAVVLTYENNAETGADTPLYQVIDKDGKVVFESKSMIADFINGSAVYSDESNRFYQGYINTKGEILIEPQFLIAYPFNEQGEAYALTNQEVYVKIDTKGTVLDTYSINPIMRSYIFADGYLIYQDTEKGTAGAIHLDGSNILDPIYGEITYLGNDLFGVKQYEEDFDTALYATKPFGILDKNRNIIADYLYYDITTFTNGYASATDNTTTYLIGLDGKKASNMPILSGRGTMIVVGDVIQGMIDNELIYVDTKGNPIWQSNIPIQLDETLIVNYEKYKANKYVLVYYPSLTGHPDIDVQNKINENIKAIFTDHRIPDLEDGVLTVSDDFDVYKRNNLLVVHRSGYDYALGAAHGTPISFYYFFDLNTGDSYQLKDLFQADSNYISVLNTIIEKDLQKQIEKDSIILEHTFDTIRDTHTFYLTEDELVIYFVPYEITAYALGFPEVRIPFEDIEELLNTEGPFWKSMNKK